MAVDTAMEVAVAEVATLKGEGGGCKICTPTLQIYHQKNISMDVKKMSVKIMST